MKVVWGIGWKEKSGLVALFEETFDDKDGALKQAMACEAEYQDGSRNFIFPFMVPGGNRPDGAAVAEFVSDG